MTNHGKKRILASIWRKFMDIDKNGINNNQIRNVLRVYGDILRKKFGTACKDINFDEVLKETIKEVEDAKKPERP